MHSLEELSWFDKMNNILAENILQLNSIFEMHKISNAYVFGSILQDNFSSDSDIDFLINFNDGIDPLEKGELWWDLYDKLKLLFGREVDLITETSLKNPYFIAEVNKKKVLVYG